MSENASTLMFHWEPLPPVTIISTPPQSSPLSNPLLRLGIFIGVARSNSARNQDLIQKRPPVTNPFAEKDQTILTSQY